MQQHGHHRICSVKHPPPIQNLLHSPMLSRSHPQPKVPLTQHLLMQLGKSASFASITRLMCFERNMTAPMLIVLAPSANPCTPGRCGTGRGSGRGRVLSKCGCVGVSAGWWWWCVCVCTYCLSVFSLDYFLLWVDKLACLRCNALVVGAWWSSVYKEAPAFRPARHAAPGAWVRKKSIDYST